ncbi:MAG: repressor [Rubrivivax sp. SCN 71-131]|nr:MAG: repressor [Rubrivivax sp. SCN 71-131]
MTAAQFAALAELLRLRGGPAQEGARLVLVDGLAPAEAARWAGLQPSAISNALTRCRTGLRLAQIAAGQRPSAEA